MPIRRTTPRIAALLALAALATTTAAVTASADTRATAEATPRPTPKPPTASLKGQSRMDFPDPAGGHDIRVTVDARAVFDPNGASLPTRSWGTFRIYHRIDPTNDRPGTVNWGDFKVDCLTTGGPTATVTGKLVKAAPGGAWEQFLDRPEGVRMGVSFYVPEKSTGGGPARIGLSGATAENEPLLTKCMAPAADAAVIDGGYHLKAREE
ncbi:hypothetical protein ACIBKX_39090 [Streptomyces sp. NPDC050658]|uniref:hypothetical protein n=1 Tax=unclassified Streptomyces TaxID=2593676 RepID=UPI00343221D7